MSGTVRQAALLALAAFLSWWVLLRVPPDSEATTPRTRFVPPPALEVTPLVRELPKTVGSPEAVTQTPAQAPPGSGPPALTIAPEELVLASGDDAAAPAPIAEPETQSTPLPPRRGIPEVNVEEAAAQPVPVETRALSSDHPDEDTEDGLADAAEPPPAPAPPELGTPEGDSAHNSTSALSAAELPDPAPVEEDGAQELQRVPAADPSAHSSAPLEGATPAVLSSAGPRDAVARAEIESLMSDPGLLADARAEFSGGNRRGFATVLLATPEDQLAIARFFGEELVVVPRRALDPELVDPRYFRVADSGEPRVVEVEGAPPLESFRQYRDLFDYEYRSLPPPLRELRRSVASRTEIYLFAALLSPEEWALVIARRQEALERAGRELAEVRRFVLRYRQLSEGAFDLVVDEIVFADGTRFRPGERGTGD